MVGVAQRGGTQNTNFDTNSSTKNSNVIRGFEQEIELIWSIKSGKAKVMSNGKDISYKFPSFRHSNPALHEMIDCKWEDEGLGVTMQILVHAEESLGNQYELLVDGKSFFGLPTRQDLGLDQVTETPETHKRDISRGKILVSDEDELENAEVTCNTDQEELADGESDLVDCLSDLGSGDYVGLVAAPEIDFRLSMVGLSSSDMCNQSGATDPVVDELHSELYTPMLETLRRQITDYLPQLEDMVSRAIINAFFVDTESQHSFSSSSDDQSDEVVTCDRVEATTLHEAYNYWDLHLSGDSPAFEEEELRLSFMQEQIDAVFIRVRNEELFPEQAARILLSVAGLVGFKFAKPIKADTVILAGLPTFTSDEDLLDMVSCYGTITACSVDCVLSGFGFCRFENPDSASRLESDFSADKVFLHGHHLISVRVLSGISNEGLTSRPTSEPDDECGKGDLDVLPVQYPNSPGSPIPHLMAPLSGSEYDATCNMFALSQPVLTSDFDDRHSRFCSEATVSTTSITDSDTAEGFHQFFSPRSVSSILDPRTGQDIGARVAEFH